MILLLSIQDVGKQVLSGNPKGFYVFAGSEYGIKKKYLDIIKNHYGYVSEAESVVEILEIMNRKRMIPLQPKLYIIRYDEEFIQGLDKQTIEKIQKIEPKIIGTLVCLCEQPKHSERCEKYLSDYTVSFDGINSIFTKKYLIKDFPHMDESLVDFALMIHKDYVGAYNVCISLSNADTDVLSQYSGTELSKSLGVDFSTSDIQFKQGVASRNFEYCLSVIDNYNGPLDSLLYALLSVLIELEKVLSSPKQHSNYSQYAKCWNVSDVYNMFMNVYAELEKSRNLSTYNTYVRLVYLLGLLQFSPVPEVLMF